MATPTGAAVEARFSEPGGRKPLSGINTFRSGSCHMVTDP